MSILLDVFAGKTPPRPPVWFMRQAGRVLKSYRNLRKKHSFATLLKTPELAVEVTLQPVRELGVDAAILFSDILVVPEALGLELKFTEQGPRFVRSLADGCPLAAHPQRLNYIYEVIRQVKKALPPHIPLIGFCGGPLTVFCYMVEGLGGDGHFSQALKYLYQETKASLEALEAITEMSLNYVAKQIEAGIDVFQLFETWAGLVPYTMSRDTMLPHCGQILDLAKKKKNSLYMRKELKLNVFFIFPNFFFPFSYCCRKLYNQMQVV